jgi:hypothetical protein
MTIGSVPQSEVRSKSFLVEVLPERRIYSKISRVTFRKQKNHSMTSEERESLIKIAEMALSLSPEVENRIRQIAPYGMSESDYYVQMLEDILGNRTLTAENVEGSKALIKEHLGLTSV